jgi:hypothetical protein
MHSAFLIVAVVLFVLDAILYWTPQGYGGRIQSIGLAFFAASFIPGIG